MVLRATDPSYWDELLETDKGERIVELVRPFHRRDLNWCIQRQSRYPQLDALLRRLRGHSYKFMHVTLEDAIQGIDALPPALREPCERTVREELRSGGFIWDYVTDSEITKRIEILESGENLSAFRASLALTRVSLERPLELMNLEALMTYYAREAVLRALFYTIAAEAAYNDPLSEDIVPLLELHACGNHLVHVTCHLQLLVLVGREKSSFSTQIPARQRLALAT